MKPEIWMPFYGQDFDRDTKGWDRSDRWSYWAAIWAYWCDACRGLPNDDDMLCKICECLSISSSNAQAVPGQRTSNTWEKAKQLIFGEKFTLREDGRWHQKRAEELYKDAQDVMTKASNRGKAGAKARWNNAQALLKYVLKQSHEQCSSPSPSPSVQEVEQPPNAPSFEQVKGWVIASNRNGSDYTVKEAHTEFLALNANGWMWGKNPVADWRSAIESRIQDVRKKVVERKKSNPEKQGMRLGYGNL